MSTVTPAISAIVLAAGNGARFGGDKLQHRIQYNDSHGQTRTHAMGVVSALNVQPFVDEVLCIIRPDDETLAADMHTHGITTCHNSHYKLGMSTSIHTGVRHAKAGNAVMICLGDMPFIHARSYQTLMALFKKNAQAITRLCYQQGEHYRGGHPVIFPSQQRPNLLQLNGDQGAQSLLRGHPVVWAPCDDKGIIFDIDTQQDALNSQHL